MKQFFKKVLLISSFWLFLSSFLFASGYSYNKFRSCYGTKISEKENTELICTNYLYNNDLYIEIKFKQSTPTEEHLKTLLESAKSSIDAADDNLDRIHNRNMNINYKFIDQNGSTILTATYDD